jgi:hypothetical protein
MYDYHSHLLASNETLSAAVLHTTLWLPIERYCTLRIESVVLQMLISVIFLLL